jgi:hypothetical protein
VGDRQGSRFANLGNSAITIATLVYAVLVYRRLLKYEEYHAATVGQSKFFDSHDHQQETGNSISISATGAAPGGRNRSSSIIDNPSSAYESRTTGLKGEVDRAMGAEFGWTGSPSGEIPRSSSVVGSGTSNVHTARVEDLPRTQSWMSQRGLVTSNDGGDNDDDDGTDTVRGSHDMTRHGNIPTVVISGHDDMPDEDDTRALLGGRPDLESGRSHTAQYKDRSGTSR